MTKETITIAALRLFWLRGYKYVSLIDVASELGITKGGIYHYFSSKEELLHQAVQYMFGRFEAKYGELFGSEKSLPEILRSIIVERELELYAQTLLAISQGDYRINHVNFVLETMQNFPDMQKRIDQSHAHCHNVIRRKIEKAMTAGEIGSDFDSQALATIIFAILSGQHTLVKYLDTPAMRQGVMDNISKMLRG
jgi:AcrR family transcriptional regulator